MHQSEVCSVGHGYHGLDLAPGLLTAPPAGPEEPVQPSSLLVNRPQRTGNSLLSKEIDCEGEKWGGMKRGKDMERNLPKQGGLTLTCSLAHRAICLWPSARQAWHMCCWPDVPDSSLVQIEADP
ncbi:hypothetical protein AOLI_G00050120 [Acnodon oligacanthus]